MMGPASVILGLAGKSVRSVLPVLWVRTVRMLVSKARVRTMVVVSGMGAASVGSDSRVRHVQVASPASLAMSVTSIATISITAQGEEIAMEMVTAFAMRVGGEKNAKSAQMVQEDPVAMSYANPA